MPTSDAELSNDPSYRRGSLKTMTAKEQLLAEAPQWSEEQAARALRAAAGATVDEWGSLEDGSQQRLLTVIDRHLATAKRHPDGTTDRWLAADRDR
jgi:hypothetical protein